MTILVLGLVIFLGLHSIRIVAEPVRAQAIARFGEGPWKGIYSLISAVGFVLIVWGFSRARYEAAQLWTPLPGARHATITLMLVAMILLGGYLFKRSHIAVVVHHPMVWSIVVFGFAHLLANGSAADALLFGAFLVWARRRPVQRLRARPAQRRRLSGARLGRDRGRGRGGPRALRRHCILAARVAVRGFAAVRLGSPSRPPDSPRLQGRR